MCGYDQYFFQLQSYVCSEKIYSCLGFTFTNEILINTLQNIEILLIEWIDMHNFDQKKLGKGLAEMHLKTNAAQLKRSVIN